MLGVCWGMLAWLMNGKSLSAREAVDWFHTMKCTSRISDLRSAKNYGFWISDEWDTNPRTGKRFKVYYCTSEDIARNKQIMESHKIKLPE